MEEKCNDPTRLDQSISRSCDVTFVTNDLYTILGIVPENFILSESKSCTCLQ